MQGKVRRSRLEYRIVAALGGAGSRGLTSFYVYRRLKVLERDFFHALGRLVEDGVVLLSSSTDRVSLSQEGQSLYYFAKASAKGGQKPWREIPESFRSNSRVDVCEPYVPDFEAFVRCEGLVP